MISGAHPPAWLNDIAVAALALAGACAAFILLDIFAGRRQKMAVMNVVWPVTALYFGPLGLWAYWWFGRPGATRDRPFWQSVFIGDTHCGAGCALGDAGAEWLVFATGLTIFGSALWAAYAMDFAAAYVLGIAFQYFAIAPMRNLSGWPGLKAAIKADTISLTSFELGMFAWMAFSAKILFQPRLEPAQPAYWFSMQIAMIAGFMTSFPANWWLIRRGLKEIM